MEHMQDRGFDEKLRKKMDAFTPNVPEHLWYNIEKEIDEQPVVSLKRRKISLSWIKIAASIALILVSITLYVKRPHEVIYLSGKKIQNLTEENALQTQPPVGATEKNDVIEWNVEKPLALKEKFTEQKTSINVATQDEQRSVRQFFNAEIKRPNISLVSNEIKLPVHAVTLTSTPAKPIEEAKRNKRGFGISDVLNYVVASVDQGDKKIISFANDEEGILKVALDLKTLKTKL